MFRRALWLLPALVACKGGEDLEGVGLVGDDLFNPFPSRFFVADGHVSIPSAGLPVPVDGTPIPVDRVSWRTGFSPAQVSVVRLEGMDPAELPTWRTDSSGVGDVLMVDLTDNTFVPVFAELDAHPDAVDPVLLVRPQVLLPFEHEVAVVITTGVGPRPARFDALIDGKAPQDLEDVATHYQDLVDTLEGMGIERDRIALAWDFPIGSGSAPLDSVISQLAAPGTWDFPETKIRDRVDGDRVATHTWRAAEGTFDVQDFLVDDRTLDLQADGSAQVVGTDRAYLYVHIPESVADAPAGTVPVVVFGHGIFGHPTFYLDNNDDNSGVLDLAEEGGFILVGTLWRGMYTDERLDALGVAADFGQLPMIPDRLVQGQLNTRTLISLLRDGDLLADPVFNGATGQSLPDTSGLGYYGISLGGIQGAVLMGTGAPLDAAVLHVGGGAWSTMLERSTQWPAFELFMLESVPDPADRQLLYAASQLFWDQADPVSYAGGLGDAPVLWQESLGDEQVPNMTTRLLARSAGATTLSPPVIQPWGMQSASSPIAAAGPVLAQFDPEKGEPLDVNRPPEVSFAHDTPRKWPGARFQAIDFLDPDTRTTVIHHCGQAPCSASNPGD